MFTWLLNAVFPITCLGNCGRYNHWLCEDCQNYYLTGPVLTSTLLYPDVTTLYGLGSYHQNLALRKLIHTAKYRSIPEALQPISQALSKRVPLNYDVIIPIPLHPRRLRERGFNQSDLLAKQLLKPIVPALVRNHYTTAQATLNRADRLVNLQGAFRLDAQYRSKITNQRVLLVDDVMTTGSTLLACAQVLRQAGVSDVMAAVVAIDE